MPEIIKKHENTAFLLSLTLILAIGTFVIMAGTMSSPTPTEASAVASTSVTVNAVVSAYITIAVSTTSTYLMPNLVSALGVAALGSSTVSTTISTNDSLGYTLYLQGTYGGVSSTPNIILSVASSTGSSTIAAGTDGYGANATSSQATIGSTSTYNFWGQDIVGAISSTTNNLISYEDAAGSNRVTRIKIYAAADVLQPSGTYQDHIILTATGKTP